MAFTRLQQVIRAFLQQTKQQHNKIQKSGSPLVTTHTIYILKTCKPFDTNNCNIYSQSK
jgi:hypothetical protein